MGGADRPHGAGGLRTRRARCAAALQGCGGQRDLANWGFLGASGSSTTRSCSTLSAARGSSTNSNSCRSSLAIGAVAHERREIEDLVPEGGTVQQHRDRAVELARLREGEDLEQFVEGAEAAREHHQRPRQMRKPQLAHEEVVKFERQLGRDVGVGQLLLRQADVEPDTAAAAERSAVIGRLHDPGAAAGAHDQAAIRARATPFRHQPRKLRRLIDVATEGAAATQARRPEEHHGRGNAREAEGAQGTKILGQDTHRATLVRVDELRVVISQWRNLRHEAPRQRRAALTARTLTKSADRVRH